MRSNSWSRSRIDVISAAIWLRTSSVCACREMRAQPRIPPDRLADAGGGQREQMQMLGTEVIDLFAFDIQHADEPPLVDERDGELGANGFVGGDIVLNFRNVVDQDGVAGLRDAAYDALAEGNLGALHLAEWPIW